MRAGRALVAALALLFTTFVNLMAQDSLEVQSTDPKVMMSILKGPVMSISPTQFAEAVDTLDTSDPRVKLVLRGDKTWDYIKVKEAFDNDDVYTKYWNTTAIDPYNMPLDSLPDRMTLWLVDSVSNWCVPNQTKVFSKYGYRKGRRHNGIDLPYPKGTPCYAAFDGKVRMAMYTSGFGNLVIIRHPNGLETFYGHLSKINVAPGDWVSAGDVIGLGGSTGRSTGPHLHFETRINGYAFDPQWLADYETGTLRHGIITIKKKQLSIDAKYVPESEEVEEEILLDEEQEQAEAARKAAEEAAKQYHTIKSGDTLGALAIKYHTSVNAICKLNGITTKTVLKIGRKLRVK